VTEAVQAPFFTVAITAYEREADVQRCIESCFRQEFTDFEVVVVDDGSTDRTVAVLQERWGPKIRVLRHPTNRGINPARHTAVSHARGQWVVMLDSDWELFPYSLRRLCEIIAALPANVRVVRSRLLWDDGRITPKFVPDAPIGYEERIQWVEDEGGWDAGRCLHRSVFRRTPYFDDRRGAMERLYELELARNETTLCVEDILGMEHTPPNSYLRSVNRRELIPRLLADAGDMSWMAETTLQRHGAALQELGPRQYREVLRAASLQAFLLNDRRMGLQYALKYLRSVKSDPAMWATIVLGLLGPKAVAYGTLAFRRLVN
jgi:glycosyltransferase involved in cell wall biosynthesis